MDERQALEEIAASAARGELVFPTHAEMALRVRRALDDPDSSVDKLAKLIQAEPLLAARVVGMANSVTYNRTGRPIVDIRNAITRVGFKTLRALVTAVVVRQMEEMPKTPAHKELAIRLWEHTAHVASLAYVLAKRVTHQDPDTAFFAGIVHEVGGFYLISRAADYPGLFESGIPDWDGDEEARVGRAVLQVLGVPEPVVKAIEALWEGLLAMPPETLGDTLLLADQLAPVESPLSKVAGMSREGVGINIDMALDDETLSGILEDAAEEVKSLTSALQT
jgi:HD-like signal output (HDOD) protein